MPVKLAPLPAPLGVTTTPVAGDIVTAALPPLAGLTQAIIAVVSVTALTAKPVVAATVVLAVVFTAGAAPPALLNTTLKVYVVSDAKPVTLSGLAAGVMVCTTPPAFDTVTVVVVAATLALYQVKPTVVSVTTPIVKPAAGTKAAVLTTLLEASAIPIWLYAATVYV